MPTIPLYDTTAPPDGYHRVIAPGGYEWWHVVASADPREMQLTIDFLDGDTFDVGYRRAYERYVERPTSVPPPLPRDHPAARVILTEQTVPSRVFGMPVPRGAFRYSEPPRAVAVGESSLVWRADGSLAITLRGFSTTTSDTLLEGDLELVLPSPPTVEPAQVRSRGFIKGVLREVSGGVVRRTLGVSGDAQYTHSFDVKPFELR